MLHATGRHEIILTHYFLFVSRQVSYIDMVLNDTSRQLNIRHFKIEIALGKQLN